MVEFNEIEEAAHAPGVERYWRDRIAMSLIAMTGHASRVRLAEAVRSGYDSSIYELLDKMRARLNDLQAEIERNRLKEKIKGGQK